MKSPDHPGVLHYMIHCYDDPVHATIGFEARRKYARVAGAAAHAQQCLAHFLALGMWDDVVASNESFPGGCGWNASHARNWIGRTRISLPLRLEYGTCNKDVMVMQEKTLAIMEVDARKSGTPRILSSLVRMRAATSLKPADGWRCCLHSGDLSNCVRACCSSSIYERLCGIKREIFAVARKSLPNCENRSNKSSGPAERHPRGWRLREAWNKQHRDPVELNSALLFVEGKHEAAIEIMKKAADSESGLRLNLDHPKL